jgi:hypothetical protein
MILKVIWPVLLLTGSLLAGVFFNGGPVEEEKLIELPAFSERGLNTFGCMLNNQTWTGQQVQARLHVFDESVCFSLNSGLDYQDRLAFIIPAKSLSPGVYVLDDPAAAYVHLQQHNTECLFTSDEFYQGMLTITAHDKAQHILSGTFEFLAFSQSCGKAVRGTHGRFDVVYSQY